MEFLNSKTWDEGYFHCAGHWARLGLGNVVRSGPTHFISADPVESLLTFSAEANTWLIPLSLPPLFLLLFRCRRPSSILRWCLNTHSFYADDGPRLLSGKKGFMTAAVRIQRPTAVAS